jgi:hypothetical protein
VTRPDPGRVLRRAIVAWGLGHLLLGRTTTGRALIVAELVGLLLVAWLTIGLGDSSAYLVPFLAGVAFIVAWAWQAVDAYRSARRDEMGAPPPEGRSAAAAIGWLSLPLLVWGTGFWIVTAHAATPAAVLDRFVTDWSDDGLEAGDWPAAVLRESRRAARALGSGPDRFSDVRIRVASADESRATAVVEAIHYERRASHFLWVFPGTELVPVADEELLTLDLAAAPVELPGGGDIGAVRWGIADAEAGS